MVCGALLALINLAMTRGKLDNVKDMQSKKDKTILSGHHVAGA